MAVFEVISAGSFVVLQFFYFVQSIKNIISETQSFFLLQFFSMMQLVLKSHVSVSVVFKQGIFN
jgi:hypothetical protein